MLEGLAWPESPDAGATQWHCRSRSDAEANLESQYRTNVASEKKCGERASGLDTLQERGD